MSRLPRVLFLVFLMFAGRLIFLGSYAQEKSSKADFEITASYIEACSCDMFCPCYFNTHSTNHMDEHHADAHFCRANLVLKVDKGYYKETKLGWREGVDRDRPWERLEYRKGLLDGGEF